MTSQFTDSAMFIVPAMDCSNELAIIQKGLSPLVGAGPLAPDYLNRRLRVAFDPRQTSPDKIASRLAEIGFPSDLVDDHQADTADRATESRLDPWTIAGGILLAAALAALLATRETSWPVIGLGVLSTLVSGWPVARSALRALRLGAIDMNALVVIASIGAILTQHYFEGATAMFLFGVSLALERFSLERARRAIHSLVEIAPRVAHRLVDGATVDVTPEMLAVGDLVLVKPGERIPIDGVVVTGHSAVNQAAITGESVPAEKSPGDEVYAGTFNGEAALEVEATRRADDTALAHVARLVDQAQRARSPTERFVDRFARRYTPAVIALAVAMALFAPWVVGGSYDEWIYRGLVLLVIACPCALVISTPVTIVCGLHHAARRGVLIKGGQHLETAGRIDAIALDKTGTLTTGQAVVERVLPLAGQTEDDVLRLAAALETTSEHPLARTIVHEAQARGLDIGRATDFQAIRGFGVRGVVGRELYYLGNARLFAEQRLGGEGAQNEIARLANGQAQTLAIVGTRNRLVGAIAIADRPRSDAAAAIAELKRLGIRPVIMLTGDARPVAERLAAELGVDEVRAELLPQDKVDHVARLMHEHPRLAMVGDGVNDAPALAASRLGIALGSQSSDTAMETADVVIMAPHVGRVVELVRLGRRCQRLLWQNIGLSLAIKGATLVLAAAGVASMWMAVAADVGASLIVIANGMRLLNGSRDEQAVAGTAVEPVRGAARSVAEEQPSLR